jgi:hypothetical protein
MAKPSSEKSLIQTPFRQDDYDAYNKFIFSRERNIFFKMVKRVELFLMIKDLAGDILECGVFKGSGMAVWAKLLDMYSPHSIRKVIGFDMFDPSFVEDLENPQEQETMRQVFSRCPDANVSLDDVTGRLRDAAVPAHRFALVPGDISTTAPRFLSENPGMRIALLYLDMDLEKPTYDALVVFWDRIVKGGIIVFDEYGYNAWTESNAVDRFISEKKLRLHKIDLQSPTAYVIKH